MPRSLRTVTKTLVQNSSFKHAWDMSSRSGTAFGVLVFSLPTGGLRYRCDPRLLSGNPSG